MQITRYTHARIVYDSIVRNVCEVYAFAVVSNAAAVMYYIREGSVTIITR